MPLFNFDKYLQLCFYISLHKNQSPHSPAPSCSLSALALNFPYRTCVRSLFWVLPFDLVHSDTLSIIHISTNYRLYFSIIFYHSFRVSSSRLDKKRHLCIGFPASHQFNGYFLLIQIRVLVELQKDFCLCLREAGGETFDFYCWVPVLCPCPFEFQQVSVVICRNQVFLIVRPDLNYFALSVCKRYFFFVSVDFSLAWRSHSRSQDRLFLSWFSLTNAKIIREG